MEVIDGDVGRVTVVATSPNPNFRIWGVYDTDNFGGDYPNEKWIISPAFTKSTADQIAKLLNAENNGYSLRCYKVADRSYQLQPGFEP
jgi:hypothetical protein